MRRRKQRRGRPLMVNRSRMCTIVSGDADRRSPSAAAPSQHVRGTSLASLPSKTDDNKMRAHRWSTRAQLKR